jgi:hypothetical protein
VTGSVKAPGLGLSVVDGHQHGLPALSTRGLMPCRTSIYIPVSFYNLFFLAVEASSCISCLNILIYQFKMELSACFCLEVGQSIVCMSS